MKFANNFTKLKCRAIGHNWRTFPKPHSGYCCDRCGALGYMQYGGIVAVGTVSEDGRKLL